MLKARSLAKRIPPKSVIFADSGFGIFSVAYAMTGEGHQILFRLTKSRFKSMRRVAQLLEETDSTKTYSNPFARLHLSEGFDLITNLFSRQCALLGVWLVRKNSKQCPCRFEHSDSEATLRASCGAGIQLDRNDSSLVETPLKYRAVMKVRFAKLCMSPN